MIPIVDPKKNYWVIRADGGAYFNKFIEESFVALSHVDELECTADAIDNEILDTFQVFFRLKKRLPTKSSFSIYRQNKY